MANVLFISETFLKDNTLLHENIDFKYLRPVVLMCQDIHIQHKIGTTLYDELKTQITASSLTAANLTLLEDYIQPSLLYWVQAEAPTAISYKFLNKGLHQQSSENSSNASLDEINFIQQRYKDKAEWYTERLVSFLLEKSTDYPAYANPNSGLDTIQPDTRTYTTGLFLGRTRTNTSLQDKYEHRRKS
tara:strand:- start:3553 stop:4116 length:564 start_codon:yes stop_codon:yes gene_type:complete